VVTRDDQAIVVEGELAAQAIVAAPAVAPGRPDQQARPRRCPLLQKTQLLGQVEPGLVRLLEHL